MSPDGYHEGVYSSYRPTSAELRPEVSNVPPGTFREEVSKGSSEDPYVETDPITAYVIGTTAVTVNDWNSLGHTATVETQRSVGGGSQLLTDDVDGSQYRRYWADDEWSEWEAAGGGGLDHLAPVEADTHDESDTPEAYQSGFTLELTTSGWADTGEQGELTTYLDLSFPQGHQTFVSESGGIYQRLYNSGTSGDWSAWERKDGGFLLEDDAFEEADEPGAYPADFTVFVALTGANWNSPVGTPAIVRTTRTATYTEQLFTEVFSNLSYRRTHDGNDWSSWEAQINQATLDFALGTINDSITNLDGRVSALENP